MSGIEYVALVFSTIALIIIAAAISWNKRNNQN